MSDDTTEVEDEVLDELEGFVQGMREEGENDLRSVLYKIQAIRRGLKR